MVILIYACIASNEPQLSKNCALKYFDFPRKYQWCET